MQHRFSRCWLPVVLLCLALCGPVADAAWAQSETAAKTVIVLGSGVFAPGEQTDGRQTAIDGALAAAVGRVTQTLLNPEVLRQHFKDLDGLLFRQADKFVLKYHVLSQTHVDRQHRVLLQATVSVDKINEQLTAVGLLQSRQPVPTLLLLVAEQNIDDFTPRFWWGPENSEFDPIALETMITSLQAQGLPVLGSTQLRAREDLDWQSVNKAELTYREAADLGARVGADLVVVGNSLAAPSSAEVGADMLALKGTVSAHVIDTQSAEEIAKISQTALGMHEDEVEAGIEALSNAGRLAGQALAQKIIRAWQTQSMSVTRIEVVVEGTRNLVNFVKFRRALSALSGVENVQIKEMATDTAALAVDFKGTGEELAAALLRQSFATFGVNLVDITATGLRLMLVAG